MKNEYKSLLTEYMDKCKVKKLNEKENNGVIKLFYNDFDLRTRFDILKAIDNSNEMINVFGDSIIREKIEEELKNKPLFIITGQEIINKMNLDF